MLGPPMVWCNTPQIYQNRILEEILKPAGVNNTAGDGCLQWIDDSPLYANNFGGYLSVLEHVLDVAINNVLRFNIDKCYFIDTSMEW